jgi:hypothetical protein
VGGHRKERRPPRRRPQRRRLPGGRVEQWAACSLRMLLLLRTMRSDMQ